MNPVMGKSCRLACACAHMLTHANIPTQLRLGRGRTGGHSELVGKKREGDTPECGSGVERH